MSYVRMDGNGNRLNATSMVAGAGVDEMCRPAQSQQHGQDSRRPNSQSYFVSRDFRSNRVSDSYVSSQVRKAPVRPRLRARSRHTVRPPPRRLSPTHQAPNQNREDILNGNLNGGIQSEGKNGTTTVIGIDSPSLACRPLYQQSYCVRGCDIAEAEEKETSNSSNKKRLVIMFSMTFVYFLVEIGVGYMSNSMALVADSFHMLSDVAALVVAFLSVKMSPKKWSKNTFGWARAEVLGALVNAVFLVALCFSILVESVKRFITTDTIHHPKWILGVGIGGLVVNVIGIFLFAGAGGSSHSHGGGGGHHTIQHQSRLSRMVATDNNENDERVTSPHNAPPPTPPPQPKPKKHSHAHGHSHGSASQMNMRGVFLHVMADALGSVIVIISALIIWQCETWPYKDYVDPTLSLIMVILLLRSVWPLLTESAMILLQTVPTHIQVEELHQRLIKEVEGVLAIHEFHVWQLAGDRIIASAHIRCHNLADYIRIAEKVKEFFHREGIHSTTIQPEFVENDPEESSRESRVCFLACPPVLGEEPENGGTSSCVTNSCCGNLVQQPSQVHPDVLVVPS